MSEAEYQAKIIRLAGLMGWRHYHQQYALGSDRGWPDLVLVRPPRIIIAEIKGEKGRVTPAQQDWLDCLARCPPVEVYVWRPEDWDEIVRVLAKGESDER